MKECDLYTYDTVFHVVGIAHSNAGKADETIKKHHTVNTDFKIETATKVKEARVKQFIFMS